MINLIPPDAKKQVKREYWTRVIVVWLFLSGSAFLIIALVHAPVYWLLHMQLQAYQDEYSQVTDQTEEFKQAETAIVNTNTVIDLLATPPTSVLFSDVIKEIEKAATIIDGVTVSNITLTRKADALGTITVAGQAATRAGLATFRDALEDNSLFKKASLPLANLAKDRDIPFSITVTPHDKK